MPHFAVETTGEAAPLTEEQIIKVLQGAAGSDRQQLVVASSQLSKWETRAGYYSALQDIYANLNHHQDIRFLAVIQLKNGIDKYWRKTSNRVIEKAEKIKIRSKAIETGICEPLRPLALQNALILSKIVRYEFPHDWPDVISILIHQLRSTNTNLRHLTNCLTLTLCVTKELATARLQRSQASLRQTAPELFQVLANIYVEYSGYWMPILQDGNQGTSLPTDPMVITLCTLKVIRRIVVAGFNHPHRDTEVVKFWAVFQQQFEGLWSAALSAQRVEIQLLARDLHEKHLIQLAKFHLEMARSHPAAFVLLPNAIDLVRYYWDLAKLRGKQYLEERTSQDWETLVVKEPGEAHDELSLLDKIALKSLLVLRACFKMAFRPAQTFKFQHPEDKEERKRSVDLIKGELLTDTFVVEVLEILVTLFFALRPSDLREWEEDPSEWEKREEEIADAWEFSIRSCSEKLFLDLMIHHNSTIVPILLQVFYRYASPDNHDVLLKDSLYNAVGLAAAVLNKDLDFNAFMRSTLLLECQSSRPSYHIIRRRLAVMLGQWTPVIPDTIEKPVVYQIFATLLSKNQVNDTVVRVTAGRQLRPVLEPFEFSFNEFAPYTDSIFKDLMMLIRETDLVATKMALIATVRVAVERMGTHVEPFSDEIMEILPSLWQESGHEHIMMQAILALMTAIITSLAKQSLKYHSQILPLIRESVQPEAEPYDYLMEEALELWSAVVQQTPSNDPPLSTELLSLSDCLPHLVNLGSDSLRQAFNILESYTLISPQTVLAPTFLEPLLSSLRITIEEPSSTSTGSTQREITRCARFLEVLVKSLSVRRNFPDKATQLQAGQHLVEHATGTSFMASFLSLLRQAFIYHQNPRPSRHVPAIVGPTETDLFSVLARLALLSPSLFAQAVSDKNGSATAEWVISEWIRHFETIGDVYQKKLHALAITSLYCIASPPPVFMLEQLQSMLTMWTDIVTELSEDAPEDTRGDYLYQPSLHEAPPPSNEWGQQNEAPEEERKREVAREDPVYQLNIREFIARTVESLVLGIGGREVFQTNWLGGIDGAVVKAFADLGLL